MFTYIAVLSDGRAKWDHCQQAQGPMGKLDKDGYGIHGIDIDIDIDNIIIVRTVPFKTTTYRQSSRDIKQHCTTLHTYNNIDKK